MIWSCVKSRQLGPNLEVMVSVLVDLLLGFELLGSEGFRQHSTSLND